LTTNMVCHFALVAPIRRRLAADLAQPTRITCLADLGTHRCQGGAAYESKAS
jgi:hypothetical protein